MSSLPSISLVTPSYGQARFLGRCLDSVLGQGYAGLEYIVMDGGSRDGSRELIEERASRLAYWQSQADGGQAAAIQAGFARAKGEVLGWLNSDDLLLPGALEAVGRHFAAHPWEDWATGAALYIDEEGEPARFRRMNFSLGVRSSYDRLLHYEPQEGLFQQATFWRRSAYEAVGGLDPSLHYGMDYDLFLRLAARGRVGRIRAWLAAFRWHGGNKTHQAMDVFLREKERILAKHAAALSPPWLARAKWAGYHAATLARKAAWLGLRGTGLLRLPEGR